jgi:hypothetical protein
MKAHIGVDAQSGLVHSVIGRVGKVGDITHVQQFGLSRVVLCPLLYCLHQFVR